ncbi:unnamed protein product [Echinostoma caproni]|uniref:TYR_PHOSPHATASE_2 domain-containing protein n=1 Tax=Echinostoma caproni TaxID=27848 RepID=A0A183BFE8_9TREM|nr:unnamed protein product [Echinostoma caproni]
MGSCRMPMLPPRWLNCPRMGDMILDIFIPFKTPLDSKFDHFMEPDHIFHVDDAFQSRNQYKLGLVVDLTKSRRFYNRREVSDMNCKYLKIELVHSSSRFPLFDSILLYLCPLIGVHCTHGFNRTGFMIIAYLVEELNYGVDIAVRIFADARPPGIYKADYLEDLFARYGSKEDCPPAPALPNWCIGEFASSHLILPVLQFSITISE